MKGKNLTVFGAEKKLDFVASDDVVAGIRAALTTYDRAKNDVYNIAYGRGQSVLVLAQTVARLANKKIKITIAPNRPGEIMEYVADITKAQKILHYHPTTTMTAGIKETMEWFASL
jgi:UDP-glucose 4-epimerase